MTFGDLLSLMQQRAERLGLVDQASGHADAAELLLYLEQALFDLTEAADIPAYTFYNDSLAQTTAGQAHYPLPDTYGRLLLPRVRNRRGFYVFDQVRNRDLEYVDPNALVRHTSLIPGVPQKFTVQERTLWLFPTPDAAYMVRGTYMKALEPLSADTPVNMPYPGTLIDQALMRLATDAGKQVPALLGARQEGLTRLVAGSR